MLEQCDDKMAFVTLYVATVQLRKSYMGCCLWSVSQECLQNDGIKNVRFAAKLNVM